jgi:hypothetical protein
LFVDDCGNVYMYADEDETVVANEQARLGATARPAAQTTLQRGVGTGERAVHLPPIRYTRSGKEFYS